MVQRYKQGCVDVIQLDERATIDELEEVQAELDRVLHERLAQVVVDLRRVRLIDSAGLELLQDTQVRALRRGGAVRFAAASPLLRDVFRVTGLDQEFAIHSDVATAAGAFAL
ncbi:MAG: STAS domain-containing protein [Pirellulaceae bacterium]